MKVNTKMAIFRNNKSFRTPIVSSTLLGKAYTPIHQIREVMGITCKPNDAYLEHSNRCTAIQSIRYPILRITSYGSPLV